MVQDLRQNRGYAQLNNVTYGADVFILETIHKIAPRRRYCFPGTLSLTYRSHWSASASAGIPGRRSMMVVLLSIDNSEFFLARSVHICRLHAFMPVSSISTKSDSSDAVTDKPQCQYPHRVITEDPD